MASITTRSNGSREVQFLGLDDKKHSVRLGKINFKAAGEVKNRIEQILACQRMKVAFDADLSRSLPNDSDDISAKLAAAGLIQARASATVGGILDDYVLRKDDINGEGTMGTLRQMTGRLREFFGIDRDIRTVNAAEAETRL